MTNHFTSILVSCKHQKLGNLVTYVTIACFSGDCHMTSPDISFLQRLIQHSMVQDAFTVPRINYESFKRKRQSVMIVTRLSSIMVDLPSYMMDLLLPDIQTLLLVYPVITSLSLPTVPLITVQPKGLCSVPIYILWSYRYKDPIFVVKPSEYSFILSCLSLYEIEPVLKLEHCIMLSPHILMSTETI
jgi:hypothetical protein